MSSSAVAPPPSRATVLTAVASGGLLAVGVGVLSLRMTLVSLGAIVGVGAVALFIRVAPLAGMVVLALTRALAEGLRESEAIVVGGAPISLTDLVNIAFVAGAGWWLLTHVRSGEKPWKVPLAPAMIVFLGIATISLLHSPGAAMGLRELVKLASVLVAFVLVMEMRPSPKAVTALMMALLVGAIAPLAVAWWQFVNLDPTLAGESQRIASVFGHPNTFGLYLVAVGVVAYGLRDLTDGPTKHFVSLIGLAAFVTMFLALSRSALLAAGIVGLVVGLKDRRVLIALIVVGGAVVLLVPSVLGRAFDIFTQSGTGTSPLDVRVDIWSQGIALFQASPIIGSGWGSFQALSSVYAHSDYLRTVIELGIVGLAPLLVLVGQLLWRTFHAARGRASFPLAWHGFAIAYALFAVFTNNLDKTTFQWYFWTLTAIALLWNQTFALTDDAATMEVAVSEPKRVFVLGLDALEPRLIDRWVQEGRLPNIGRVVNEGAWGRMRSVPNRNSAPAWTSMVTGLNSGKHGIFYFTEDDPESYGYRFINGSARRGKAMWDVLSEEERSVGVINVPMTFPADEVNGFLVAGLDAPGTDHPRFTYPPEVSAEIAAISEGRYATHGGQSVFAHPDQMDEGLKRLHSSIEARARVGLELYRRKPSDFFMLVFTESDVIQHFFWRQMEEPAHDDPPEHRTAIYDVYAHLDRVLGDVIEAVDDDSLVMVVSDHGARRDDGLARALPDWLEQTGFLKHGSAHGRSRARAAAVKLAGRLYRVLEKRLSTAAKHRLSDRFPRLRRSVEVGMSFASMDWAHTRAYTDGKRPEIWINLIGRQRHGIVPPQDYERVRDEIIEVLTAARTRDGKRLVENVFKREKVFTGPFVERSPDLIVEWGEEAGSSLEAIYPDGRVLQLQGKPASEDALGNALSGGHSQFGVVGLWGPGVTSRRLDDVSILDVAPSVLYALDAPIPEDVDGRVIEQAFTELIAVRPPRMSVTSADDGRGDSGYSTEEEQEIHDRLQSLGYVE